MMTELLFREDAYLRTATARVLAVNERGVELDRTVFYPQGGGQAGDSGKLVRPQGEAVAIIDTRKGETPDRVLHVPAPGSPVLQPGETVTFDIDFSQLNAERIERETNALIVAGAATETVWITDAELDSQPELVKTMSVQPPRGAGRVRLLRIPGIDLQPCGGTHVADIVEIEGIRVLKIRSEGKRNKRVEIALSGSG